MDWKDVTLEALKKERPELVEEIQSNLKEKERIANLEIELKTVKEAHTQALATVQEENKKLLKEQADMKIANEKRERDTLVESVLIGMKLPDSVKYEVVEGKKAIKSHFRNVIDRCTDEKEMKSIVTDWEKSYAYKGPISEAKDISFEPVSGAEDVDRMIDAFLN